MQEIKQLYQAIKSKIEAGGILSLAIRLTIGALLGILSGSTILGMISKYGLFFFAYFHGARIPIEGLDVLSPAATLFSFILSTSVSFFILIVLLLTYLSKRIIDYISLKTGKFTKETVKQSILAFIGSIASIVSGLSSWYGVDKYLFAGDVTITISITIGLIVTIFTLLSI
jgi:hypothetical protein